MDVRTDGDDLPILLARTTAPGMALQNTPCFSISRKTRFALTGHCPADRRSRLRSAARTTLFRHLCWKHISSSPRYRISPFAKPVWLHRVKRAPDDLRSLKWVEAWFPINLFNCALSAAPFDASTVVVLHPLNGLADSEALRGRSAHE